MDWHKTAGGFISDNRYQIVPIHRGDNGNLVYRALKHNERRYAQVHWYRELDADDAKELCERD
jgi:hypothetical protein